MRYILSLLLFFSISAQAQTIKIFGSSAWNINTFNLSAHNAGDSVLRIAPWGVKAFKSFTGITESTGDSSNLIATTAWVKRQSYTPTGLSIYTVSSFLTSNRMLTGRNNLYGLVFDSLSYFIPVTRSKTNDSSSSINISPGFAQMKALRTTGTRSASVNASVFPGAYAVEAYTGSTNNGLYIDSVNNVGIGTTAPAAKVHLVGTLKVQTSIPGVGKALVDTSGAGDLAYRGVTPISPGAPTFSPSGSVTDVLGTGYSVNITGSGDHFKITINTGTGITTNGTIGNIILATSYSITPVVVYSAAEVGSIGAPVGFNGTNANTIIVFNKTNLTPSTTYSFNLISGL